jgi:hypothetical protein
MKIPLNITVDVDPAQWRAEYQLEPGEDVRADVRSHFLTVVQALLGDRFGEDAASAHHTR